MPEAKVHIHPTAELAERVLLPGDPGRALRLAQELIAEPKMFNHNRGLWGYSGPARADGRPLTIQATGMGGPSTAIVATELIELGARRLVRVGTTGGLLAELELGELIVATEAISDDGASRALGAGDRVSATLTLDTATGVRRGPIVSTDLFYGAEDREPVWRAAGALAVEMEAATLFTLAHRHGVQAGCALLVSDLLAGDRDRIDADALHAAELRLGGLAIDALS